MTYSPYQARLLQAVTNVVLAMNGEPEPQMTDSTDSISEKLDLIATKLRLGAQ